MDQLLDTPAVTDMQFLDGDHQTPSTEHPVVAFHLSARRLDLAGKAEFPYPAGQNDRGGEGAADGVWWPDLTGQTRQFPRRLSYELAHGDRLINSSHKVDEYQPSAQPFPKAVSDLNTAGTERDSNTGGVPPADGVRSIPLGMQSRHVENARRSSFDSLGPQPRHSPFTRRLSNMTGPPLQRRATISTEVPSGLHEHDNNQSNEVGAPLQGQQHVAMPVLSPRIRTLIGLMAAGAVPHRS